MQLSIRDHSAALAACLDQARDLSLSYRDASQLPEKTTELLIDTPCPVHSLDTGATDFLLRYEVFPARILTFAGDWSRSGRLMRPGDIIVQQAFLPPGPLSLKLVFAVRVLDVQRSSERVSFRYGTLQGHAEQGEAEFLLLLSDGCVTARIHTFSQAANALARWTGIALPFQAYCTRAALQRIRHEFLQRHSG
ncbi:DUF1990 family protein [Planctomicrobium sp. SH664]|uniref:DUF1990 family protein n=1 Tax=Planctomicrobium sp. SH664 TaxID=3448125 RepID=UPI003F5CA548